MAEKKEDIAFKEPKRPSVGDYLTRTFGKKAIRTYIIVVLLVTALFLVIFISIGIVQNVRFQRAVKAEQNFSTGLPAVLADKFPLDNLIFIKDPRDFFQSPAPVRDPGIRWSAEEAAKYWMDPDGLHVIKELPQRNRELLARYLDDVTAGDSRF